MIRPSGANDPPLYRFGNRRYRLTADHIAGHRYAMKIKAALLLLAVGIVVSTPSRIKFVQAAPVQQPALPGRLSDAEFWNLASSLSEPGGYFRIVDNFTSNENEIGHLFPRVEALRSPSGVYLGVGPEQNLTYIAALRPA